MHRPDAAITMTGNDLARNRGLERISSFMKKPFQDLECEEKNFAVRKCVQEREQETADGKRRAIDAKTKCHDSDSLSRVREALEQSETRKHITGWPTANSEKQSST